MEKRMKLCSLMVLAIALSWFFLVPLQAQAQAKKPSPVEGASFDSSAAMADNLKIYIGKDVIVHLRSGKSFQGYVKSVGNGFVHIEKIASRDFYDALVRTDDISAVEARFREMK